MAAVCFYFHVHQPYRVKRYSLFDIGSSESNSYFDSGDEVRLDNKMIFKKVARKCYLPANEVMLRLLKRHPEFKIAFSITGVFLEQAQEFNPEVLESFRKLIDTGKVEIVAETYYHSLAYLYSENEFKKQVRKHADLVKKLFGVVPNVFRNTELIYNNNLATIIEKMGYEGILAEGADHILGWRSPNYVYHPKGTKRIKLLLKNYRLSDDIAFRFSNKGWKEHPLTVDKYSQWLNSVNGNGEIINLFMDYETFGEHQWEDTGIFKFLDKLPGEFLKNADNSFITPTEAVRRFNSFSDIDMPHYVSWADMERDLSAWRSNAMQHDALEKIYELEGEVLETEDEDLIHQWRKLQTSDHFYYMCTKWFSDGDVHKYFSPYESPYEAYITFMNVLHDLKLRLKKMLTKKDDVFLRAAA